MLGSLSFGGPREEQAVFGARVEERVCQRSLPRTNDERPVRVVDLDPAFVQLREQLGERGGRVDRVDRVDRNYVDHGAISVVREHGKRRNER
jgi:hypothetical protein